MLTRFENIQKAKSYSDEVIGQLRADLSELNSAFPNAATIVVGSLARREASPLSDLDYFVVYGSTAPDRSYLEQVNAVMERIGLRPPALDGAFAELVSKDGLLESIGGSEESNRDLTRRMLLLLESDWVTGEAIFNETIDGVIQRYIRDEITQHQLARFFLNDVIRYYRTICVDFEYKTVHAKKSWGDRNIKIMFSRKLLYFSGVLAAAQTTQSDCGFKRSELRRLLRKCPIDRIYDVAGTDAERALARYDQFLGWMADTAAREVLRNTTADRLNNHTSQFREMKNSGHHFSWELESLLHRRYAPTQPIFQALIL